MSGRKPSSAVRRGRPIGTHLREPVIADPLEREIAKTLRRRRVDLQWSQCDLATYAGVSYNSVQRIEEGIGSISLPMARDLLGAVGYGLVVHRKEGQR